MSVCGDGAEIRPKANKTSKNGGNVYDSCCNPGRRTARVRRGGGPDPLLILIIKFKVHAMISILIGAVGIGLMAGMPPV